MQQENQQFNTPILFLIFNRPDLTKKVFGQIKKIKPRQLFIAADGPRESHPNDKEKCVQTRQGVIDMIDWECEVKTLFREENLGCGIAVSQAITWFFEYVEMGIILEDDCFPELSFFRFCKELLEYYKDDERVMHIGGSSYILDNKIDPSYFISAYPHIWGWATWSNRWLDFKYHIVIKNKKINLVCKRYLDRSSELEYWTNQFDKELNYNAINSWALRWHFNMWNNKGYSILPSKNLVLNLGDGDDSTHTKDLPINYQYQRLDSIEFPIKHPQTFDVDVNLDQFNFDKFFTEKTTFTNRLRNIAYKYFNKKFYEFGKKVFGRN